MPTKIEWCDEVFNPVWGCNNNCPYCYARKIAKRFCNTIYNKNKNFITKGNDEEISIQRWDLLDNLSNFKPVWIESNFQKKFSKKPSRIFVNSMSDIAYWKPEWVQKVLAKIKENPQHTFLFLTKTPLSYKPFEFPENCLLGCTITDNNKLKTIHGYFNFLSIEPLLTEIDIRYIPSVEWIIIGSETGNRKGKIIPKKEWIDNIILYCRNCDIPIFLKDSLRSIYHDDLIQEFPK